MAHVIITVTLEHDDPHDGLGEDLEAAVSDALHRVKQELEQDHGVKSFTTTFEDVV